MCMETSTALRRKGVRAMISASIERCAGIDIHKKFLAVCVMVGALGDEARVEKRRYGTTVKELSDLRQWLVSQGVTHVVMESTGSYWKPVFNVLENAVKVYLANPKEVKNRKGRFRSTDVGRLVGGQSHAGTGGATSAEES